MCMKEAIIIGQETEFTKTFTLEDVISFAAISEDDNPIHINQEYASQSIFGQQVVHGILLVSMFSKILGTIYPGVGTIYLSQTSKFTRPVFIGEAVIAKTTLLSYDSSTQKGTFLTECHKNKDTLVLSGQAKVLFPERFYLP